MKDAATRMRALAESLVAEHDVLDFTLDSLKALEAIVRAQKRNRDDALVPRWAAYLGETMIRNSSVEMRWTSEPEGEPFLVAAGARWFPSNKLEKFLESGPRDSPAAFARVALAMVRPGDEGAFVPLDRATFDPAGLERFDSFLAAPSFETLQRLDQCTTILPQRVIDFLLLEDSVQPSIFYPFFAIPAVPHRSPPINFGRVAARWVWMLLEADVADRERVRDDVASMVADENKSVRENAAYLRARIFLREDDTDAFAAQYGSRDRPIRLGTLGALGCHTHDARPAPDLGRYGDVLTAALRRGAKETSLALEATQGDLTPVLDPLLEILETGSPGHVAVVLSKLTSHAHDIKHARAPYDRRVGSAIGAIVRHARPLPGKQNMTRVQIDARYALSAYVAMSQHLEPEQRAVVEEALARASHVR